MRAWLGAAGALGRVCARGSHRASSLGRSVNPSESGVDGEINELATANQRLERS